MRVVEIASCLGARGEAHPGPCTMLRLICATILSFLEGSITAAGAAPTEGAPGDQGQAPPCLQVVTRREARRPHTDCWLAAAAGARRVEIESAQPCSAWPLTLSARVP